MSTTDLGQTSRTISGVDRVQQAAPSRTPSPSVGSFPDLGTRKPREDDSLMQKATPPARPPPQSHRMPPPATKPLIKPQLQVPVVQYDSVIPETEADATSDELQWRERRTKSKNDVDWEGRLTCGDEEVSGRLKRKKGHQRVQPHEKESDVAQKRKLHGGSSRRGTQSQAAADFEGDIVEFSTSEGSEGEGSEDDFEDTPSKSQQGIRARESHIDRFLRESCKEDDLNIPAPSKGKNLSLANRRSVSQRTRSSQRGRS